MADDQKRPGTEMPANDNRAADAVSDADDVERLDAVVLSIARLIGRRIAREHHEKAIRAANDNNDPLGEAGAMKDDQCSDDD